MSSINLSKKTKKHECKKFRTFSKRRGLFACRECGKVYDKSKEPVVIPDGVKPWEMQ